MPSAALLGKATRARTLPVMLAPVAVGAALASYRGVRFAWGWFALTMLGAAALHMGANVLNDYFDARTGADKLARIDRAAIPTGSGLIESGQMSARGMLGLAGASFAVAAFAGAWLAAARGLPVLWLGLAGAVLAVEYVGPPLRLGYRTRGAGDVAIFISYGCLPVVGAYFVQARRVDAAAVLASIVPGILTTLVIFHSHFLHWRADKAAGKMTPVAVLGPDVGLAVSGVSIVIAYVALALQVAFGLFPAAALIGMATIAPLAVAWSRALRDPAPQRYLQLLGATLGASLLTGAAIALSLAVA